MRQPAFDDGNRAGGLDSFADVLATVLNSSGLRDSLHTTLLDANPLKPSSCDQSGPFGSCLLRSRVDHRDLRINGPNSVQLTLVNGGLRANVGIQNLRVN